MQSEAAEWKTVGAGMKRRIAAKGGSLMAAEITCEQGACGALHSHPHEQITYVLSGSYQYTVGDDERIVYKGDAVYIPGDITHGMRCLQAGALLDVFTPQRQDFL